MFGYVMANPQELTPRQRERYLGCYCGICRAIGANASYPSRLVLNYDMVFLALLLSSLYEPAEEQGQGRCLAHPLGAPPLGAERGRRLRGGYERGPGLFQRRGQLARRPAARRAGPAKASAAALRVHPEPLSRQCRPWRPASGT